MNRIKTYCVAILLAFAACWLSFATSAEAEVRDRIVAIVNSDIILLSEYREALRKARQADENISEEKALIDMTGRLLILQQARRLLSSSAGATDDDAVINGYIDRNIRSFIHIPIERIEDLYMDDREKFAGRGFFEVKDEIEEQLVEKELEGRVLAFIEELKKKSFIRIQLAE